MNVSITQTTGRASSPTPLFLSREPKPASCRVDLVLAGVRGQVGSALRRLLGRQQPAFSEHLGLDLKLIAAFDSRGFAFDLQGMEAISAERDLSPRGGIELEQLLAHITRSGAERTVFIDCTASDDIADCYPRLLAGGVGVVGANKRANSRSLASYHRLQRSARLRNAPYRYETTVGAAIPLLGPLRDLRLRGERVTSIRGVLSGSLSYILHRLHEGSPFSGAVLEAQRLGYTEPDPLEDLRAADLSRKLLVLAREAGFGLEQADLQVSALLEGTAESPAALEPLLRDNDAPWGARVASAHARGERWVVIAEADSNGGRVQLESVPASSPFGQLLPGQNLIQIRTDLQDQTPLSLSGAGAGVEITAAGLLSDVLSAALQLAGK